MQPNRGLGPMLHASGIIRAVNLEGPDPAHLEVEADGRSYRVVPGDPDLSASLRRIPAEQLLGIGIAFQGYSRPGPGKLDTVVAQQLGLGIFPGGPAS